MLKFEPELADPFEARGRMMEWRDKALEHFDVVSRCDRAERRRGKGRGGERTLGLSWAKERDGMGITLLGLRGKSSIAVY